MNHRQAVALTLLGIFCLSSPSLARKIPPVSLEITGEATPELLADFRQALERSARNQPEADSDDLELEAEALSATVDLDQFWKVEPDVPYAGSDDSRQQLDIIYPFEGEPPYRFIMNFHGGDWQSGSRKAASVAPAFWAVYQGYALVNVGYRLADEATWPAQLHDAKAAVRFIRANAEHYELDAENIVVWGASAGGHLAQMLAATNGDATRADPDMGHAETSSAVQGLVSWNGVADITNLAPPGQSSADALMGYPAYQSDLAIEASPIHQISADFPPALLIHGTHDQVVPFEQSALMAIRINAATAANRSRLQLVINAGHYDDRVDSPEVIATSLDFVDTVLFPDETNPHRSDFYPSIQTLSEED